MSGRGRSWALLGGVDPTPGEPDVVDHIVTGLQARAETAAEVAGTLTGFGHAVGGSTWEGAASDAFLGAYGPTPTMVTTQQQAYADAVTALRRWSATLEGLQASADRLLEAAEANDDRLQAAEAALPGAITERRAAAAALRAASDAGDDTYGAHLRHDRAVGRVGALQREVETARAEARRLLEEASALREEHTSEVLAVAGAVAGATPAPLDLLPFAIATAAVAADAALPGFDAAGEDGIISPAELARLIQEGLGTALGQDLDDEARRALERLLAAVARDRATAAAVVTEWGEQGVVVTLAMLDELGRYPEARELTGLADGILGLISTASGVAVVRDLLIRVVTTEHNEYTAALLASIDGLDPAVVVAIAEVLLTAEHPPHFLTHANAFFPNLSFGGAVEVVLLALAAAPGAVEAYLSHDTRARIEGLLAVWPDGGIAEATLQVLLVALASSNPQARDVAHHLIESIAEAGAGGLDITVAIVTLLAPHIGSLVDDTFRPSAEVTHDVWQAFLVNVLDGLDGKEVQAVVDIIVAVAVVDAGLISLPTEQGLLTLVDVLKNEMREILGPLQDALEANELSIEQAQAAISAGVTKGASLASAIALVVAPTPAGAIGRLALKEAEKVLVGFVADLVSDALSPDAIDAPSVQQQAARVATAVLPELVGNPEIRQHLVASGAATVLPSGVVPSGTPPEYVVGYAPGLVVVVTENFWETLQGDLADALGAGWSG